MRASLLLFSTTLLLCVCGLCMTTGTMKGRREGREPHTFLDSCHLAEHTSPRLNDLRHSNRSSGNPEATTSTVFNRFSSVSPQQPGISYDSANSTRNGVGGSGYMPPPPPPPPPPSFLFGGGSGANSRCVGWPPPLPSTYWTLPQDAPWIPPPPIPHNTSGPSCGENSREAAARWPTPQDIPFPSTFPFPPHMLPPFLPISPNMDWSHIPPPPPWFPMLHGPQDPKEQQRGNYREDNTSIIDGDEEDGDDDSVTEPDPRRGRGPTPHRRSYWRQPSISAREEEHMRLVAREAKRRQQRASASHTSVRDPVKGSMKEGRQALRNLSSTRGRNKLGATPASARRLSPSPANSRHMVMASRSSSRPISHQQRRNYYAEACALKVSSPRLKDAMEKRPSPQNVRMSNTSRDHSRGYKNHAGVKSKNDNGSRLSNAARHSGIHHTSYQDAPRQDERVAEYLKGIEDIYKRLRSSYEEFQRDPSKFIRNASALKEAALAKAPPLPSAAARPSSTTRNLLDDVDTVKGKRYNTEHEVSQGKGIPLLSQESQRIRDELCKLEMQWQRLEELKRGSTGERGAAPVEMLQEKGINDPPMRMQNGTGAGKTEINGGEADGRRNGKQNEGITSMDGSQYGANVKAIVTTGGIRNDKPTTGALSRSSTPRFAGDPLQNGLSDSGQWGRRNLNENNTTSGHGPFTRDHVLGLVRERKAMLE
ncbi:hypothetical protein MOQ_005171 [Trypanosoma cruzi marinkellei]|uniref:Uncharacterized protein n=1 Tax=Trypanosoma cruzi marinkellei TaxID=85056 RepID=K2M7H9_TRYCR|nr:hypothetical protein MOQ_005171 [Trypanosoma cruzi marinkellei]